MSFKDEQEELLKKFRKLGDSFNKNLEAYSKELADSLADAERDFGYFRQHKNIDDSELQSIAKRMQLRATQFEVEHPKFSNLFREFAELLRGMGV